MYMYTLSLYRRSGCFQVWPITGLLDPSVHLLYIIVPRVYGKADLVSLVYSGKSLNPVPWSHWIYMFVTGSVDLTVISGYD